MQPIKPSLIKNLISKIFHHQFFPNIMEKKVGLIGRIKEEEEGEREGKNNSEGISISTWGHRFKFAFITFLNKKKKETLILPSNFNPEAHIKNFPPYIYGFPEEKKFNIDKMNYILGLLTEIPAKNKDIIDEDGFVPIYTPLIQNHIKEYPLYFKYLLQTDVLRQNSHYAEGKSMSYAWAEEYVDKKFVPIRTIEDPDFSIEEPNENLANFPYLMHWYNTKKLTINKEAATAFAWDVKNDRMPDKSKWQINKDTGRKKNPINQYQAALYNIYSCYSYDYKVHIDDNVHRLHSVLTYMQHEFRNFVTYDNTQLVCIDIKNCNLYLACAILNTEFWNPNSTLPISLQSLPHNIQDRLSIPSLSIMLGKFFSKLQGNEFDEYIHLVSTGSMYESIMKAVKKTTGNEIPRVEAKTAIFSLIFSSNRNHYGNKVIRDYLRESFPTVLEIFQLIKKDYKIEGEEKPHARLACLLQSIESEIILHRCCKRIWEEGGHKVPIFTIHDSIVTTKSNEKYVYSVMMQEFERNVGVAPSLSIEYWGSN